MALSFRRDSIDPAGERLMDEQYRCLRLLAEDPGFAFL